MANGEIPTLPAPPTVGAVSSINAANGEFTFKCPLNTDPEPKLEVLDPDGDLYLVVGETKCIFNTTPEESESEDEITEIPQSNGNTDNNTHTHQNAVTFLVCSKSLSRASPVWKCLLYGGFRESRPMHGTQWKVRLPEDKLDPMTTILKIIHGQFINTSVDKIDISNFYRIIVLAEKYDVIHVLQPWTNVWLEDIGLATRTLGLLSAHEFSRALYILWVLGCTDLYEQMVMFLVLESSVDATDRLSVRGFIAEYILNESMVKIPNIIGLTKRIRMHMLEPALKFLREFQENPILGSEKLRGNCKSERCINEIIGSLATCMVQNGFWPVPEASDNEYKLISLKETLWVDSHHSACMNCFNNRLEDIFDCAGAERMITDHMEEEKSRRRKMAASIDHREKYRPE
ncbi:hypothetical protein F4810DRAFT_494922 [Camillea tinctor]|nr:hypothetical protein F4810DRAFT_494922 [Camillea tinctor]